LNGFTKEEEIIMKTSRYILAIVVIVLSSSLGLFLGGLVGLFIGVVCGLTGIYIAMRIWPNKPGVRKPLLTVLVFMLIPFLFLIGAFVGIIIPLDDTMDGSAIVGAFFGGILGLILAIILTIIIWFRKEKPVVGEQPPTTEDVESAVADNHKE
jgi:hypothetical protein